MIPIQLLVAHFFGDFVFQCFTDWGVRKSKDPDALFKHVGLWSLCLLPWGWKFALMNFTLHLVVDQTTSQWTTKTWFVTGTWLDIEGPWVPQLTVDKWKRSWFFIIIGFDQLLHQLCLWGTYALLQ